MKNNVTNNDEKKIATVTIDLTNAPAGFFYTDMIVGYLTALDPYKGGLFQTNLYYKTTPSDSAMKFEYFSGDNAYWDTLPTFFHLLFPYSYHFDDMGGEIYPTPFVMSGHIFQYLFPCVISSDDTVDISVKFIKNQNGNDCLPEKDFYGNYKYPFLLEVTQFTLNSSYFGEKYVCKQVNEFSSIPSNYPINEQLFDSINDTCTKTPFAFPTSMSTLNEIINPYNNVKNFNQIEDINKMAGTKKFNNLFRGYSGYLKFLENFKNNKDFYIHYKSILSAITKGAPNPFFQIPCPTATPCQTATPCPTATLCPTATSSKTNNTTLIIVSSVLGGTCLALICITLYYYWKYKNGKR